MHNSAAIGYCQGRMWSPITVVEEEELRDQRPFEIDHFKNSNALIHLETETNEKNPISFGGLNTSAEQEKRGCRLR